MIIIDDVECLIKGRGRIANRTKGKRKAKQMVKRWYETVYRTALKEEGNG